MRQDKMTNQVYQEIEAQIPNLRRYAMVLAHNPVAADDLLQQSMTRALMKSHLFEPGTNLRAWLFTIMHNVHVSNVRHVATMSPSVDPDMVENTFGGPAPQDSVVALRAMRKALAAIPDGQRTAVLMAGVEGMSYEEIAERLNISIGTVKSRIHRGRRALRAALYGRIRPRPRDEARVFAVDREPRNPAAVPSRVE
jgi:RNA polymerase sigma-70 factor (ECF subfamily)